MKNMFAPFAVMNTIRRLAIRITGLPPALPLKIFRRIGSARCAA